MFGPVIKAARKHLARLEAQAAGGTPQRDLFAAPLPEHDFDDAPAPVVAEVQNDGLRDALDAIDPDALTPREALERLYELKRLAA